jgi:membrane protease YdiL (CAAX protease family)
VNVVAHAFVRAALRVIAAFLLGATALVAAGSLAGAFSSLRPELGESTRWIVALANHTGMLLASFVLALVLSRGRISAYGFRMPTHFPLARIAVLSCGISALANVAGRFLLEEGLPFLESYSFVQTILLVWIYASLAEEVLARGLVQSFLAPLAERGLAVGKLRLSVPVLAGAAFFGGMHLMLLTMGIDPRTVLFIVAFTFVGGLVAGYYREQTDSLIPAVVAHSLLNVTGSILGLLWQS